MSQDPPAAGRPDYRGAARAGTGVLQRWYSRRTGLWKSTGWWNAANALTAVIGYCQVSGDRSYLDVAGNTFTRARRRNAGFINEYFDDNLWWALAWVAARDLTGEQRYLDAARAVFAHSLTGWDGTFGGGLWWNQDRRYKNAITNELFLALAARLAQRVPGDQSYQDWALRSWDWLHRSGLIGPGGLVNDGLSAAGANNGGITWTYNQGVILGGLAALHELTGDQGYLRQGEAIADAALRDLTDARGILAEPCEPAGCDGDQTQFKGIFTRNLHQFARHSGKRDEYRAFITANADSVLARATSPDGEYGLRWAGPFDKADASRQSAALEVIVAAAAVTGADS